MKNLSILRIYLILLIVSLSFDEECAESLKASHNSEAEVQKFLCSEYEKLATEFCNKVTTAEWEYARDMTNKTKKEAMINATLEQAIFRKDIVKYYVNEIDKSTIHNPNILKQLKRIYKLDYAVLQPDILSDLTRCLEKMTSIHTTAKICPYKQPNCNVTTEGISFTPEVENIMANSFDYDELLYTWIAWHDATGAKIKPLFTRYLLIANEAAIANNYTDRGHFWRAQYETTHFQDMVNRLWRDVEPLYVELHTYIRHIMYNLYTKEYGEETEESTIPAHILGDMWGQNWINIKALVMPFPNETLVTDDLFEGHTVADMFKMANDYFKSMGMLDMSEAFDTSKGAVIQKPPNASDTFQCQPLAWDFCNGSTYRIRMCAEKTFNDFLTIHHELGHIQYYMLYKSLPILYRSAANPAFDESIGDVLSLSIISPKHLKRIGLLKDAEISYALRINSLMEMALIKVAFLPFAYSLDKWRWDIFAERIEPDFWNEHYWKLRLKYQRVRPPILRGDQDFDAGSKYHVAADLPYMSYFISHILQFQIFKAMCSYTCPKNEEIDFESTNLMDCDLMSNRASGNLLMHVLKIGSSLHWKTILRSLVGQSQISAEPLLEYFDPLYQHLMQVNKQFAARRASDHSRR